MSRGVGYSVEKKILLNEVKELSTFVLLRQATEHSARELAAYKNRLVSDGGHSVEANCFRARNNLERIAPGAICNIAPASSMVYS